MRFYRSNTTGAAWAREQYKRECLRLQAKPVAGVYSCVYWLADGTCLVNIGYAGNLVGDWQQVEDKLAAGIYHNKFVAVAAKRAVSKQMTVLACDPKDSNSAKKTAIARVLKTYPRNAVLSQVIRGHPELRRVWTPTVGRAWEQWVNSHCGIAPEANDFVYPTEGV